MVQVLQDTIRQRDQINNGIFRKEAVPLIADLSLATKNRKAEDHLDYLIKKGRLSFLSKGG